MGPMARKFLEANGKAWEQDPNFNYSFQKQFYFFYGTLKDPEMLAKVLRLPSGSAPQLRPAKIVGYGCKLWGPYPALVDMPRSGSTVSGMAYEVQSKEEADLLQAYETDKYTVAGCRINFQDGGDVSGLVFMWNASMSELKEMEET